MAGSLLTKSKYITGSAGTTQVSTGSGILRAITITEAVANTISIYDNVSTGTTTPIAVFKASTAEGTYWLETPVSVGIKVVTAGASKLVVIYE